MAIPNNRTPNSGQFNMFMDKDTPVQDTSLESAIKQTIASGVRPSRIQNFLSLISSIPDLNLINNAFGTKGVSPSNMGQLRGFPKPTVNLNFQLFEQGGGATPTTELLLVTPTLSRIVGFQVVVTLTIEEITNDDDGGALNHQKTITFDAGDTEATSSQLTNYDGNDYQVNTREPSNGNDQSINVTVSYNYDAYYDNNSWQEDLTWQAGAPSYTQFVLDTISGGNNCSGTPDENAFYAYSSSGTIANGIYLYVDTGLGMKLSSGWYVDAMSHEGEGMFNFFYVNSAGQVSGFTVCEGE